MMDGQESISKASYLFDSVEYGLVLKDSQIEELEPEEIGSWNPEKKQFQAFDEWLTEKDENKAKPVEEPEDDYQEIDMTDVEIGDRGEELAPLPELLECLTASTDY